MRPGLGPASAPRIISVVAVAFIVAVLALVIVTLAAPRTTAAGSVLPGLFDPSRWDVFNDRAVWRSIGTGVLNTLRMAGTAAVLALVIGTLFSFVRTVDSPPSSASRRSSCSSSSAACRCC